MDPGFGNNRYYRQLPPQAVSTANPNQLSNYGNQQGQYQVGLSGGNQQGNGQYQGGYPNQNQNRLTNQGYGGRRRPCIRRRGIFHIHYIHQTFKYLQF